MITQYFVFDAGVSRPCTDAEINDILARQAAATDITTIRANKIASLTESYDTARYANVSYMSTTFQADAASVDLLQGAITNYNNVGSTPTGFYWVDAANNQVAMTLVQLQGLGNAVASQVWTAFQHLQNLKAQVNAASTTDAVNAIVW